MAHTVILHVGAPKTGTSFVQDLLRSHRDALAEHDICFPGDRFDAHFLAAIDLMGLSWGGLENQAHGAWDALAGQVRAWPGTAIVSHEILATASTAHVARALQTLTAPEGAPTQFHIVYSARDLVRQLPAEWQENLKHRNRLTYAEFLAIVRDPARTDTVAQWFWGVQEVPEVLRRWGETLPAAQVHLVTVPPAGADPTVLWHRMAAAMRLDPTWFDDGAPQEEPHLNVSLGVAEAAMLRALNVRIDQVVENHHYRALVREAMVHQGLSRQQRSARLTVPADVYDWAVGLSRSWVADLALRGTDVIGTLDDLVPTRRPAFDDPDTIDDAALADAAMRGLTAMTLAGVRLREREAELLAEVEGLHAEVARSHSTPIYRMKQRVVAAARRHRLVGLLLSAYRRVTGRNSRSA